TYVYSAQRCLCTSAVSGNMILQDPTARHTFVLTVNLTSSLGPRGREAQSEFG
ncbi:unnamed protein product, partial [Effrenium voratum]